MPESNVDVVRAAYDAFSRGDVPGVVALMDPEVEWTEAENFPYADGNPYRGPDAVVEGVFARLGGEWEDWSLSVEHVLDAGPNVVALGRYRARYPGTGTELDAQFAHVWWLRDGRVTRFQQYTDTAQVLRAMGEL